MDNNRDHTIKEELSNHCDDKISVNHFPDVKEIVIKNAKTAVTVVLNSKNVSPGKATC